MMWNDIRQEFDWDGSWRDIYALDVGMAGWRAFWRLILNPGYRVDYRIDGAPAALPHDVDSVFALRETTAPLLSVFLDTIQLNCHFFNDQDIELDLDPREMTSQAHLDLVLAFMGSLGRATFSGVVLTPENSPGFPIIRYELGTDSFVRVPPPSWPR